MLELAFILRGFPVLQNVSQEIRPLGRRTLLGMGYGCVDFPNQFRGEFTNKRLIDDQRIPFLPGIVPLGMDTQRQIEVEADAGPGAASAQIFHLFLRQPDRVKMGP